MLVQRLLYTFFTQLQTLNSSLNTSTSSVGVPNTIEETIRSRIGESSTPFLIWQPKRFFVHSKLWAFIESIRVVRSDLRPLLFEASLKALITYLPVQQIRGLFPILYFIALNIHNFFLYIPLRFSRIPQQNKIHDSDILWQVISTII